MAIQAKIRILVVDDHSLFRESLRLLLQDDDHLQVMGLCGTARDAVETVSRVPADLILLDDDRDADLLAFIRDHGRGAKVLMVTTGLSAISARRLLSMGCRGIIHKHSSFRELVQAIHYVMRGGVWLDARARETLLGGLDRVERREILNDRERAVLQGVFDGFKNKEIAAALRSSESSVKAVVQNLFEKIGVRTRGQLVQAAIARQRNHERIPAASLYT